MRCVRPRQKGPIGTNAWSSKDYANLLKQQKNPPIPPFNKGGLEGIYEVFVDT